MEQKYIGIVLIITSILLAGFMYVSQVRESIFIDDFMAEHDSCVTDEGVCLHKRSLALYSFGYGLDAILFFFGLYLIYFDKKRKDKSTYHLKITKELAKIKQDDRKKDEFKAFISGFSNEEQSVLKAIEAQEGIKQSTLRYKTGISKTGLSLMLKNFEEKKIISRTIAGKTKKVYLIKKF